MKREERNVLVVEDDAETAELFSEMLKVSGYQVQVCFNGEQAIQILEKASPDLIVLDMMMPVSTGMDVLRYVRDSADFLSIPVVVVSARGLPVEIHEAVEAGANDYLTKPVSYVDIKKAVEHALDTT